MTQMHLLETGTIGQSGMCQLLHAALRRAYAKRKGFPMARCRDASMSAAGQGPSLLLHSLCARHDARPQARRDQEGSRSSDERARSGTRRVDGKIRPLAPNRNSRKNNERPETLSSPGRPGSPPPELLTKENKTDADSCLWHVRA